MPNPKFEYGLLPFEYLHPLHALLTGVLDAKQPAFLQRLRGEYGDTSGRLERPAVRSTRLKVKNDGDDDEPLYIDEESNEVISKEEYHTLVGGDELKGDEDSAAKDKSIHPDDKPQAETNKQRNLTEVGAQRKRKQAKVVGEEKTEGEDKTEGENKTEGEKVQPKPSKKSKKAKKIKLSFDEV